MGTSSAHANVAYFTTSGTSTWTAPAGVYSVTVEVWGAGGGSGGGTNTGTPGGSGGGGGAYAKKVISVTPGNSYTYSVGVGGPVDTGAGGNTRFVGDGGVESPTPVEVTTSESSSGEGTSTPAPDTSAEAGTGTEIITPIEGVVQDISSEEPLPPEPSVGEPQPEGLSPPP